MSDSIASNSITDTFKSITGKDTAVTASLYTAAELEEASKRFGTVKECVHAALKEQSKAAFTIDEAAVIVKNFLNREVKR